MLNHLFIGLGGQGGHSLGALKKVIASRKSDIKSLEATGFNHDFLYIDSSPDVTNNRSTWTHFGENLALDPNSFLYLKDDGAALDTPSMAQRPDVAPWIGDPAILDSFLQGSQGITGANQRRRLGRLLFARNADRIRNAVCGKKIASMLSSSHSCAIHIFASLAGGTGSGCLIDLITMLRSEYPDSSTAGGFPIFLYLYVTDNSFQDAQVGYFHENQAAALRDLNYLACGGYQPNMLGGASNGDSFKGDQAITQIALSSHLNENNQLLSLEQQHQIFAEAAFERIYCYTTGNLQPLQQRALTGEDIIAAFPGEPAKFLQRSYRFGSSGMRRWEVPVEEVKELLASDLLNSCLNMMLYQNWSSSLGAQEGKLNSNIPSYSEILVGVISAIDKQKVSQSELPALSDKLKIESSQYYEGKKREGFKNMSLDDYEQGLRERYYGHLDQRGIEEIFKNFARSHDQKLNQITTEIHDIVLNAWKRANTPLGLAYVADLLTEAQKNIKTEIEEISQIEDSDSSLSSRMQRRKADWHKLTFISRRFKQEQFVRAHQTDLLTILRQDLRKKALQDDLLLLELASRALAQMASDYKLAADALADKAKKSQKRAVSHHNDLKRLKNQNSGQQDGQLANKAEFSLQNLESYIELQRCAKDQLQNACAELIEKSIADVLGEDQLTKLGRLNEIQRTKFDELTDSVVFKRSVQIHDDLVDRNSSSSVLSGHILDVLESRYNEDQDNFKAELKKFIDSSASSIRLSTNEIQPRGMRSDGGMPEMPRQVLVIGIPSGHPFANQLSAQVGPLMNAGSITHHSVYQHDDPTQIRMLTMTYWMAARYATVVHGLEAIYNKSLKNDRDGDKKYFTNIDTSGERNQRSSLLLPSAQESISKMRAALWLARSIHAPGTQEVLVQEGSAGVVLVEIDESGITTLKIGDSFTSLEKNADVVTSARVVSAVEAALSEMNPEKLDHLRAQVSEKDLAKRQELGPASVEYAEWNKDKANLNEFLSK